MDCKNIKYSDHAIMQMFKRNISTSEIEDCVINGHLIKEYIHDSPYPSCLLMGDINGKVIHVVVAINSIAEECVIITAYIPDPSVWGADFKSKR